MRTRITPPQKTFRFLIVLIVVGLLLGSMTLVVAYAPTEAEQGVPASSKENIASEKLESLPIGQAWAATKMKLSSASQSSGSLRLFVDAQPRRAAPGDVITISLAVVGQGPDTVQDVVMTDTLPSGLDYVPGSATGGGVYTSNDRTLTWQVGALPPAGAVQESFQVQLAGMTPVVGVTHMAQATSAGGVQEALESRLIPVFSAVGDQAELVADLGGWLRSADGRVEVDVAEGAVSSDTTLTYDQRLQAPGAPGDFVAAFTLVTRQGWFPLPYLDKEATLTFSYDGVYSGNNAANLTLHYYDLVEQEWVELLSYNHKDEDTLEAGVTSMGLYAVTETEDEIYLKGMLTPSVLGARASLWTGDSSYSYPLSLPPAAGGTTPSLALSYSSSAANNQLEAASNETSTSRPAQSSDFGLGWSLTGGGAIKRDRDKNYYLSLPGGSYRLKHVEGGDEWRTIPESFLHIEHDGGEIPLGSAYLSQCSGDQKLLKAWGMHPWTVRTPDGWEYQFGGELTEQNEDIPEGTLLPKAGETAAYWRGNIGCGWGQTVALQAYRWNLVKVTPPVGGEWVYEYDGDTKKIVEPLESYQNKLCEIVPMDGGSAYPRNAYVRHTRPVTITYGEGLYQVELRYISGHGDPPQGLKDLWNEEEQVYETDCRNQWNYATKKVDAIVVKARKDINEDWNDSDHVLRYYDLTTGDHDFQYMQLYDITEKSGLVGEIEQLPSTVFTYTYDVDEVPLAEVLESVDNSYGGKVTFDYEHVGCDPDRLLCPDKEFPTKNPPGNGRVVVTKRTASPWPEKVESVQSYNYNGGKYWDLYVGAENKEQWQFWGFGVVTETLKAEETAPVLRTVETHFNQSDETLKGKVDQTRTLDETGAERTKTENVWSKDRYAPDEFPTLDQTTIYQDEQGIVREIYKYEPPHQNGKQKGNRTEVQELPWDPEANEGEGGWYTYTIPYRVTYTLYYPNDEEDDDNVYLTNKPGQIHVYKQRWYDPGSDLVQVRRFYYDGQVDEVEEDYKKEPIVGLLNRTDIGDLSLMQTTWYDYWPETGNLYKVTDALGNSTRTFYDSDFKAYPICQVNALGHEVKTRYFGVDGGIIDNPDDGASCTVNDGSSVAMAAGHVFGQVEDVTDANEAVTTFEYDDWGRTRYIWRPGSPTGDPAEASEQWVYTDYVPAQGEDSAIPTLALHKVRDQPHNEVLSAPNLKNWVYLDGFGRVIQSQGEFNDSYRPVSDKAYGPLGNLIKETVPYTSPSSGHDFVQQTWGQPFTEYVYDALGRTTVVTHPDGDTSIRTFYKVGQTGTGEPRLLTAVLDEKDHQTISRSDVLGRLRRTDQYEGEYPGEGDPDWGADRYASATYEYDVLDRLTDVDGPDADGGGPTVHTDISYDALGRKKNMTDPDMGHWEYEYDAVGNLTRQTDARDEVLCFYYDSLNRLSGKKYNIDVAANCPDLEPPEDNDPYDTFWTDMDVWYKYDQDGDFGLGYGPTEGVGRRTGMKNEHNKTRWVYDLRGRVLAELSEFDNSAPGTWGTMYVTQYTYDTADRVKTMTYPDGEELAYEYNNQGLSKSMTSSDQGNGYVTDAVYDESGRIKSLVFGDVATREGGTGILKTDYTYWPWENKPNLGRLHNIHSYVDVSGSDNQTLQNLTHEYEAVGNVAKITYQGNFAGDRDVFVSKLDMDGGMGAQAAGAHAARTPLFVPNVGQSKADVRFQVHGREGTLFFSNDGLTLASGVASPGVQSPDRMMEMPEPFGSETENGYEKAEPGLSELDAEREQQAGRKSVRDPGARPVMTRMRYEGANPNPQMQGIERQTGVVNYYIGNDPARWHTNLPTYAGILYEGLYSGIDMRYESRYGALKSTYVVAPGADPAQIRWYYEGALATEIHEGTGDLLISLAASQPGEDGYVLTEQAPIAWQEMDGQRTPVTVAYLVSDDDTVSFSIDDYDRTKPLLIDPTLAYSAYLGGEGDDEGSDIAVDSTGNAYITGYTLSHDFADTLGGDCGGDGFCDDMSDAFVTKLNADGSLAYSTYLGGVGWDGGSGIAVDNAGNAYVAGSTSAGDFPTTVGAYDTICGTDGQCDQVRDAFVSKLDASGNLDYSTFVGGANWDYAMDIAVDTSGNPHVVGNTLSEDFPTTAGVIQPDFTEGWEPYDYDGFVLKLAPLNGGVNDLIYGTYLGGSRNDRTEAIAIDDSGNAIIVGTTKSPDFPTSPNPYQSTASPYTDAFVTKLNGNGTELMYGTYVGGEESEGFEAVALDGIGQIYVTGYTNSPDYPTTASAFDTICGTDGSCSDGIFAKLDPANNGSADLVYSSFFGGSKQERGDGIAVVDIDMVYLTGYTYSTDFPITADALQSASRGDFEAFVSEFDLSQAGSAALQYSTYLGGSSLDGAYDLAVDKNGSVYVTGFTKSTDFLADTAFPASRTTTFDYDDLDRLTHVNGREMYQFGPNGRLEAKEGETFRYVGEVAFTFDGDAHAPEYRSDEKGNQEEYYYDANGNLELADLITYYDAHMPIRYSWNEENRLSQVEVGNRDVTNWYTMFYVQYDADGRQVIRSSPGEGYYPAYTRHNVGSYYEVETTSGEVTKYYHFNGQRVAMEQAGVLYYLFTDHLGSASVSYRADDAAIIGQRYHPWGEVKGYNSNQLPTDYSYTGQEDVGFTREFYNNDPIRILDYGARYYWPDFGRFLQPDTIVPEPGNPQALNRYVYANNNALRYTDPTGHYGSNVHYGLTYVLARDVGQEISMMAGLSVEQSEQVASSIAGVIARADQGVDQNPTKFPLNIVELGGMSPTEYYHFQSRAEGESRLQKAIANGDPQAFGEAMHTFQDYFSHTGSGFSFPSGQEGLDNLRANCPECFTGGAWVTNSRGTAQLLGHIPGQKVKNVFDKYNPYAVTDHYSLDNPRDVTMHLATKYWITLWYLSQYGIDPDQYYMDQYGLTADEYYSQTVNQ